MGLVSSIIHLDIIHQHIIIHIRRIIAGTMLHNIIAIANFILTDIIVTDTN